MSTMFFEVTGSGENWKATVYAGTNVFDVIDAESKDEAHALAREHYPEAKTPEEVDRDLDEDYNSAEGRAWRRKHA